MAINGGFMIVIKAMTVILLLLTFCSLAIALLETYDFLECLYLEIKSKFEFPKQKTIELKFKK